MDDAWITVWSWFSGKYPSSTSVPIWSLMVFCPGTHVRRILHFGMGRCMADVIELMAFTERAVPRITDESSFTGMMTSPLSAAAM